MATAGQGDKLLLIVEAARILEQNRNSHNDSGHNGLNGYSPNGSVLKRSKRMKSQVAQPPTAVEVTDLDAYEVDIIQEDNPFANEDDEDSDDSSDHSPCVKLPKLKFQSTRPISHAKMIHNAKEKNRRKTLKQAQLALHREIQPYSHQKPILRIILCNAIEEIKRLKATSKENENCLAALKERRSSLTEQLEYLKSLDISSSNNDGSNGGSGDTGNEDHDVSSPQSVDEDSILDVEEEEERKENDFPDKSSETVDSSDITNQTQEKGFINDVSAAEIPTSVSQSPVFSSPYPPLCYYTQLLGCTTLLQSMQLHRYLNSGNLWSSPFLWPNLHAMHSTISGISGNTSPVTNPAVQLLNEAKFHQPTLVCPSPVKCSVVKSIGSIDSGQNSHCGSLKQPFFCRSLC